LSFLFFIALIQKGKINLQYKYLFSTKNYNKKVLKNVYKYTTQEPTISIMKTIILALSLLISINVFGQDLTKCGIDNNPELTKVESEFLNTYMDNEDWKAFDFTKKKALFITGAAGSRIGNKTQYFDHIRKWNKEGDKISTWIVALNDKERLESGYDVIITYWAKTLTKKNKRKLLKAAKANM
jgi:hypothetical protein